jgi:hypothetical protein
LSPAQKAWARGWVTWVNFGNEIGLDPDELEGYRAAAKANETSGERPRIRWAAEEIGAPEAALDREWTKADLAAFKASIAKPVPPPKPDPAEQLRKLFRAIRKRGVFAKRALACCQGCSWGEVPEGKAAVFTTQQDEANYKEEPSRWNRDLAKPRGIYLSFGANQESDAETQKLGQAIVEDAKALGIAVEWDGKPETRIKVTP